MSVSGTNFGKAADDYGRFRAGFPDSLFDRLLAFRVGQSGQKIVDFGTGTGTLARGFALRGCRVVGVDPDPRMTAEASRLDVQAGVSVEYVTATAEATGLESGIAEVVTAGQCWHWFDRGKALTEALRLLIPEGLLVIAHFDWLPLKGNMVEATERLIERHNPAWTFGDGRGMYPQWLPGLSDAGLRDIETFSYDLDVLYSPAAWRGRIRASAGVAALSPTAVGVFDAELEDKLGGDFPGATLRVPHRVFGIVAARRGE